jgi:transposase, IS5 family
VLDGGRFVIHSPLNAFSARSDDPGRPPLPTRLMGILKHTTTSPMRRYVSAGSRTPYYQFFCGQEFFQHRLVFDRSSPNR